jgi:biotin sulfoxide reductase
MSGVVSISEGAWYDPENLTDENPRCNAGHVNLLTSSRPTSTMAQATSINTCLVAIKKANTTKAYAGIKTPIIKGA